MRHTPSLFIILITLAFPLTAVAQSASPANEAKPEPTSRKVPKVEFYVATNEPGDRLVEAKIGDTENKIYLIEMVNVQPADITHVRSVIDANGHPAVEVGFTGPTKRNIEVVTRNNLGKRLAVVVDGEVVSAPTIVAKIDGKAIITGNFTAEDAQSIVKQIAPPMFEASLLLVKADWSQVEVANKTLIDAELRKALKGVSVPADLLDKLSASGPEILFPSTIISCYTPAHYAELLAWLKARDLIVSLEPFPSAELVPTAFAGLAESVQYAGSVFAEGPNQTYMTSLLRPADFVGRDLPLFRVVGTPQPFVVRKPVLRWKVAEIHSHLGRRLILRRRAYVEEEKRGQASQASLELDECTSDGTLPDKQVAIMNAFPDGDESAFRHAARRKGFIPLIVSAPFSDESPAPSPQPKVHPPDVVETIQTRYTDKRPIRESKPQPKSLANKDEPNQQQQPVQEEIRVYQLESADAELVASTLEQLFRDDIKIVADPSNNAVIVRSPARLFREIQELLKQLDKVPSKIVSDPLGYDYGPSNQGARSALPARAEDIKELREAYAASEDGARQTAAKLRDTRSKARASELRELLRSQVVRSFRTRQKLHRAELDNMQQKLEHTREAIAMRNQIADEIIDRRVADLLNPELRWESDTITNGKTAEPVSKSTHAALERKELSASIPAHLESLLEPLWPLQKERSLRMRDITDMELMVADVLQPVEIPKDAEPAVKQQLEEEEGRNAAKARQLQARIDSLRAEVDSYDRQIAVLKKKLEIDGVVTAIRDGRSLEISIGHDDGVRRGMTLSVFDGETPTGIVEVVKVRADRSTTRILEENATAPIKPGQRATMPIDRILSDLAGHDPGEPIYNDRLKRFKFRLEKIDVTDQYGIAEQFWLIYQGRGKPPITGVWGDPRTNSLVIVGPPEADQAIRDTLAEWEGATTGLEVRGDESLEAQHESVKQRHRNALEQVTKRKLEIINVEAAGEKADPERLKKLQLDLEQDMAELELLERMLKVIAESMQRLNGNEEASEATDAGGTDASTNAASTGRY